MICLNKIKFCLSGLNEKINKEQNLRKNYSSTMITLCHLGLKGPLSSLSPNIFPEFPFLGSKGNLKLSYHNCRLRLFHGTFESDPSLTFPSLSLSSSVSSLDHHKTTVFGERIHNRIPHRLCVTQYVTTRGTLGYRHPDDTPHTPGVYFPVTSHPDTGSLNES